MTITSPSEIVEQELVDYLSDLFSTAFKKAPFEVLCALLRVSGLQDADWDPFEESVGAFAGFNALLRLDEHLRTQACLP